MLTAHFQYNVINFFSLNGWGHFHRVNKYLESPFGNSIKDLPSLEDLAGMGRARSIWVFHNQTYETTCHNNNLPLLKFAAYSWPNTQIAPRYHAPLRRPVLNAIHYEVFHFSQ